MVHHVCYCPKCGDTITASDHCSCSKAERWKSFNCPLCNGLLLVGEHSIKPDREGALKQRFMKIEEVARAIVEADWREVANDNKDACLIECECLLDNIDRLRDALG